jgi:hypothetical protein
MSRSARRLVVGLVATAFSASCSATPDTGTPAGPPAAIASFAGDQQTGLVGSTLVSPLTVKVTDATGAAVSGVTVTWTVTDGGGTVAPTTSTTDASGRAITVLTLGATIGPQAVTASVVSVGSPAVFTVTATAAPQFGVITLVTSVPTPTGATFAHDTYVRDGLAFASMWNAGMRIYDVGNGMGGGSPGNPVLVGSIITSANGVPNGPQVHNSWWFHNPVSGENRYLFIGQEGSCGSIGSCSIGDIHIVDVSDLTHPTEVGFIHITGAGVHNFWMDEAHQFLYAAYYNAGVVKIDVSGTLSGDMSSRIVAQVQPGGPGNTYIWGVMLSAGTLYATDMLSGFWALDPVTLATKGGGNNVPERLGSDQWVYGQYAYSGTWGGGGRHIGNAIKVWSLDGNGVPTLADSVIIPDIGTVSDLAVTPDGKMLVATAEGGPGQGLYVFSRANPAKPVLAASFRTPQGEHTGEVAVINGRTYVFVARDPGLPQMDIFDITGVVQ